MYPPIANLLLYSNECITGSIQKGSLPVVPVSSSVLPQKTLNTLPRAPLSYMLEQNEKIKLHKILWNTTLQNLLLTFNNVFLN